MDGLTVEQYASYSVELALYPEHWAQIRKRYGIQGERAHTQVNHQWNDAIGTSPAVRARFHEVFAAYRAHLRDHPLEW